MESWPFRKMWSKIANFLGFFNCFPVKGVILSCPEALQEVSFWQLNVNLYTRWKLFSLSITYLKRNRLGNLVLDWNEILKEQCGEWFLIQFCSRFLTKNDGATRNDKTMSSYFLYVKALSLVCSVFIIQ